jgi:hypothetical protein
MEDDVESLLGTLGYKILKRRNEDPPFDFICDFSKRPPDGTQGPSLLYPWFSPAGRVGFSVKEGDFRLSDAKALRKDCKTARRSTKLLLRKISGGVLICNDLVPLAKIDQVSRLGIYCWDLRRLLFYSAKAHVSKQPGHSIEYRFSLMEGGSCVLKTATESVGHLTLKAHVFYDDHRANLGSDDVRDLLDETDRLALQPARRYVPSTQSAVIALHVLGLVDPNLAQSAYEEFRSDTSAHSGITLGEPSEFKLYQYRASPWFPMI